MQLTKKPDSSASFASLPANFVFSFSEVKNANSPEKIALLGNKGAQLCEMSSIGLSVPKGFTVSTHACREYFASQRNWPVGLEVQVLEHLQLLEKESGKKFGSDSNPLFVSVRSGSPVSMPGMMDTILNVGLNDKTVEVFSSQTKNPRVAWDSYRRLIQMFGETVFGISAREFENQIEHMKKQKSVALDTELSVDDLKLLVQKFKEIVLEKSGREFPQDVSSALRLAINAVFDSWNSARAIAYRKIHRLDDSAGTAATIQEMVFGNMGDDSGTGVGFTRNPSTGEKALFGEFLLNAQGEDIVAGVRTPRPVSELKAILPRVYQELLSVQSTLENHYRDMQDFEFTIEKGQLFMLQTRRGKRTAQAAVKVAVDMVEEKLVSKQVAVLMVSPQQVKQLLHKQLDPSSKKLATLIARGIPASPGAAVGKIVFHSKRALELKEQFPHEDLILVREETSAEDIEGMNVARGILTARGGATSHAAVVARGMGKCCIAGSNDILVKDNELHIKNSKLVLKELDEISLDGSTGEVFLGRLGLIEPEMSTYLQTILLWADSFARLGVRSNADTPKDSLQAREFGARGIGLCRTEHMFFGKDRILAMREMILSSSFEQRKKALSKLLPFQKNDFLGIFRAMDGFPVTIRLLDPPLHEFLPKEEKEISELAHVMGLEESHVKKTIEQLSEVNPMLGFRGVRIGIVYPEIYQMQSQAIFEAALEARKEGVDVLLEIMIPVVSDAKEMQVSKENVLSTASAVLGIQKIPFKVGVMMELPRACLTADKIAEHAEFFSFGTNDLTQTTFGYSRDDSSKFIPHYIEQKIHSVDPFEELDSHGVGELVKIAFAKGKSVRPDLKIGICGEHGGDPASIKFCHEAGLDYVSCSPYRVPIARLAAAQAAIKS